ncbi:MAG: DNA translocase FtsK [Telluria sp.]
MVEALGGEATICEPGGDDVNAVAGALHKIAADAGATVVLTAGVEPTDDEAYAKAVIVVRSSDRASISLVQRHLHIGYNRAARLIDRMEADDIVSKVQADGNRTITPTTNQ